MKDSLIHYCMLSIHVLILLIMIARYAHLFVLIPELSCLNSNVYIHTFCTFIGLLNVEMDNFVIIVVIKQGCLFCLPDLF